MTLITLYVLSVIISLPLILYVAKADFGSVTVGGMIPLLVLSLCPVVNVSIAVILWLFSDNVGEGDFVSKILNTKIL